MDLDTTLDHLHEIWRSLNFDRPTQEDREAFHAYGIEVDRALRFHPDSSDLWCIKGDWLGEKHQIDDEWPEFEERVACYVRAIDRDPTNGYAYQQLGCVYHLYDEDLATAVGYLEKSIELGEGLLAYLDLAFAQAEMGRRDLADATLALARQTFGPHPEIDYASESIALGGWDPLEDDDGQALEPTDH